MNISRNNLPRSLSQPRYGDESKSDDESSLSEFNHNIPKTAQARLRKTVSAAGCNPIRRVHVVGRRNVHQQQNIDPETYIDGQEAYLKRDPMMKKFYGFIRSKLNSLFISLFASDGGFVEKSVPTHLATKIFQGAASIVPEPALAAAANAAAKASQVYYNQEHSNRVEKAVEVCLDPYLATEYARRTAIRLCEIYEDQIKELKKEGPERLARFAITACHDFLEENALAVDQPIPEQLVKAIQEKGAEKRSIPTKISTKVAQKAERYKPSKKIVNFFRYTHLELPTQHEYFFEGKKKDWMADKLFSRCGIRVREGDQWVYYGNDNGQDNGDTGERYTRTELYGFRVGTEKEAKYFGMKELKKGTHPSRFPETIIDLPLSREKSNRDYLIKVWKAFAENCVQEIAEQNEYLSRHGGDIEQIRQEQEELRGFIKRVIAFLEQLTQELVEQGKNLSQNSESLEAIRKEQEELRDLTIEISKFSARQEEQLSQNSAALQVMHEEQRKLEEHIETLRSFSANCTQAMKKQDEHLSQHSVTLEVIQEGQKRLPKLVEGLNSFSENFERTISRQDEHLSQHSAALSEIIETISILSGNLEKAITKHHTDQLQNSESLKLIQKELGKFPDLVKSIQMFSESCVQAMETQGRKLSQKLSASFQEEMRKISTEIEKLERDRHPLIHQRNDHNLQQGLQEFYSQKKNFQLAFSGRMLDIKESFIQLAVVEEVMQTRRKKKSEKPQLNKEDQDAQLREMLFETYETIHAIKKPVALDALFSLKHHQKNTPYRKILLLGRAGTGKSTMCQKIAHMWATEGFWRDRFSYLFWVPLKNLIESRYPHGEQYLENILAQECFFPKSQEEKQSLVETIGKVLNDHSQQVVMLLDGYDETTQMPVGIRRQLFERLDSYAYMIVTSRPYGTEKIKGKMDVTLENMGFADEHIKEYIVNYFEEDRISDLIDFIKERRDLVTMAHVPLLLEMLCLLWKKKRENIKGLTMVELYQEVVDYGFNRYFFHQAVPLTELQKQEAKTRLSLALGKIALEGLKKGELPIDGDLIKKNASGFSIRIEEIYGCGFFKAVEGDDREWKPGYFMHLSIQEYLAAFYLASNGSGRKKEMAICKYYPHMQLVWTLCAGLLGSNNFEGEVSDEICHERVCDFFAALYEEPRDLIGRYHNRIAVACLNACANRKNLYDRIEKDYQVLSSLQDFIRFYLTGNQPIDLSLEFRCESVMKHSLIESLLRTSLSSEEDSVSKKAAEVLSEIGSKEAIAILIRALEEGNLFTVRCSAALGLGKIGTKEAVNALIVALDAQDESVKEMVISALGEAGAKEALEPLMEALSDENWKIRIQVVKTLKKTKMKEILFHKKEFMSSLLEVSLQAVKALNDKDPYIRLQAAKFLGEIEAKEAVGPLINALEDKELYVREAAAEALGKMKAEEAIDALIRAHSNWHLSVRWEKTDRSLQEAGLFSNKVHFLEALEDDGWHLGRATLALGKMGRIEEVIDFFSWALDVDGYESIAAESLGELGTEKAIQPLIKVLDDGKRLPYTKEVAAEALGKIGAGDAVGTLIKALGDKNVAVARASAEALGKIGTQEAATLLFKALGNENSCVRRWAVVALVKAECVEALEMEETEELIESLVRLLSDKKKFVRAAVIEVLGKITYSDLLKTGISSRQEKTFFAIALAIAKKALRHNHSIFLQKERGECYLICGSNRILDHSLNEQQIKWMKKSARNVADKEFNHSRCIIS